MLWVWKMSEEPDVDNWDEYAMSGIEDPAMEEVAQKYEKIESLNNKIPNDKITYIFDNEPRNKEIINRMYKIVEKDFNIVIWPEDLQFKDVNDMIIGGLTKNKITDIIKTNTYSKLSALTKLNHWKKIK